MKIDSQLPQSRSIFSTLRFAKPHPNRVSFLPEILLLALCLTLATPEAEAATRIWNGLGGNDNWGNAGNWVGGIAPGPGEDLVFPPGAARLYLAGAVTR